MAITFQSFKENLESGRYENLVNAQRALGRSVLSPSLKGRALKLAEVHFSSVVEIPLPLPEEQPAPERKRRSSVRAELSGNPTNGAGESLEITIIKMLAAEIHRGDGSGPSLPRLLKKCMDEHMTLPDLLEKTNQLEVMVRILKAQ